MTAIRRTLRSPYPVSLRRTAFSHGWVHLPPFEWDDAKGTLSRTELADCTNPFRIDVKQKSETRFQLLVSGDAVDSLLADKMKSTVSRWLSLDWDPNEAIKAARPKSKKIAAYLKKGGGRFLRGSRFSEDFVKTVCTINASWGFTTKMVTKIVDDLGHGTFPSPEQLLSAGVPYLKNHARFGYRAEVVIDALNTLIEKGMMDEAGNELAVSRDALLGIKGIGEYAANHLAVLLWDFSRIPVDSEVRPYCKTVLGLEPDEIEPFFAGWGEYRFLGYKLGRIIDRTNWIGDAK